MKNILLFFLFVLSVSASEAQTRWGKVDPIEFSVRKCSFDSSANAIVLLDSAYVYIDRVATTMSGITITTGGAYTSVLMSPHVITNVYRRLLILNKEGVGSSNINIPVVTLMNMQQVTNLEAQTLNINEKGKVDVKKVESEGFFYDTLIRGAAANIKFTFPDVKEGSIIEYRYTISTRGTQINDWLFQSTLPVIRSAISLKVPDYAYTDMRFLGYLPIIKDKIKHYNDHLNDITGIKAHYAMERIPGYKVEPFVASNYDNLNKIKFYPETVKNSHGIVTHSGYRNWAAVGRDIALNAKYFSANNNVAWEFLAKQLVVHITDQTDKVKAIYNYLHTVMKWNKVYGYSTHPDMGWWEVKTESDSIGNSAKINLLLLEMLHAVDIKAYPVLMSTRDHGWIDTSFCNPRQFNNVIVMAELDSTDILLDAVNPYCPWYMLPENDLNSFGLKIHNLQTQTMDVISTQWVGIDPALHSSTSVSSIINIDEQGNYAGKAVVSAADYLAMQYRDKPAGKTMDEWVKSSLKLQDDMDVKVDTVENENDLDNRLRIVFDLEKKNSATSDSILYITPFPIKFYPDNPFKQNERVNPISFEYPIERHLTCSITLPHNYKVVELPKAIKMKLNDGSVICSLMVTEDMDQIQMRVDFKIGGTDYSAQKFGDIKAIYAKMIDACNSVIVIRKI